MENLVIKDLLKLLKVMSKIFYPTYETDIGLTIQVPISYKNDIQLRFSLGGFNDAKTNKIGTYGLLVHKDIFTPRYINLLSLGKVYFKTFDKWFEFINSTDLSDIKNYQSESGTKVCITYFIMINRSKNAN